LKARKGQSFCKIQGNGNQISNNPKYPIFNFSFGHKPHTNKENSGDKGVYICIPSIEFVKIKVDSDNKCDGKDKDK
jgi:hypothetical protein